MNARLTGVLAPVVTPFRDDLSPDAQRFVQHCRWVLSQGAGLVPFGTTSEANSLSAGERMKLLEDLVAVGIDPAVMIPGTGCCSLPESVRLTEHAVNLGCAGVLMLPPFYYKRVTDEGLYRYFAEVIERVADCRLRLYLYHIPPIAQVGFSVALIERLLTRYEEVIIGIKDSSGDWANTQAVLDATRGTAFRVFSGSETFLLRNLRSGGAGCITATANVNPGPMRKLCDHWQSAAANEAQKEIDQVRVIVEAQPLIPAIKQVLAHWRRDPPWRTVRPPLTVLIAAQTDALITALGEARGFSMAGLDE